MIVVQARPASADDVSPAARAAAVELFDTADRLKSEGNISAACPKYQESYRLDPQLGALLHLADCFEQDGKLASAYAAFRAAAELAHLKTDERKALAEERALKLEHRLSRLTIGVPESSRVEGLEISRDGLALAPGSWGTALPVDAGEHRLSARAPGHEPWQGSVRVTGDGANVQFELPPLQPLKAKASAGDATAHDSRPDAGRGSTRRTLGWAAGGAGLVGAGLGVMFTIQRGNKLDERDGICPTGVCAPGQVEQAQGRIDALTEDARTAQTAAVVSFVAGGALLATGAVLLLTAPSSEQPRAMGRVGLSVAALPGLQGLWLEGAF